jgi:hypothetical protein
MRMTRWVKALVGVTVVLVGAACGGLGPGDYLIYRVAYGSGKLGADCFDGEIPESVAEDESTFRGAGTLVLYFDAAGAPWLDTGRTVLPGEGGDDAYTFEGARSDTEVVPGQIILDTDQDGIPDGEDPFVDADMDGIDDSIDDFIDTDGDGIDDRIDDVVDADGDGIDDRYTQLPSNTKLVVATRVTIEVVLDGDLISGEVFVVDEARCIGDCPGQPDDTICSVITPLSGVRLENGDATLPSPAAPFE